MRAALRNFNPRSSCEERRDVSCMICGYSAFQSTLLMRGATASNRHALPRLCISIHAPHARSDQDRTGRIRLYYISIHAPHARSDAMTVSSCSAMTHFNPRSSCEERRSGQSNPSPTPYFNPRSSCEERQYGMPPIVPMWRFQSTLLMRGATFWLHPWLRALDISIHAPHARSDAAVHSRPSVEHISIHAPHARSDVERASECRSR